MVANFERPQHPRNVRETINWLLRLGRPPLPECPIEAAKQGKEPKQPCFLDGKYLRLVNWKQWQNTQPIQEIIDAWFVNPKTGIGTLGGWNGKHWLGWVDFDQKDFSSPSECDARVAEWVEQYPVMADAPMFRTPSGGYRFLVAFSREPENFKANSGFSLCPDGSHHVGELLSKNGGHTLLPPTVGVNGKAYQWERWKEYPPVVERPYDVGLYPVQKRTEVKPAVTPPTRQGNSSEDNTKLTNFLEHEIYPRLTADVAFCWSNHDFKTQGDKLRGNCPWHESQSGTAFYVDNKDGRYLWRCPACEIGGSVIEYRHRFAGGNGSPRGRDFVDIVRQLASDVGVSMPASEPRHQPKLHPDTISFVLQRTDIVDVIGEHVVLSKRGKDFVGLCPFHDEKTPSFSVSPTKQMFSCCGCGESGDVVRFLMHLGKHSFSAVVLDLARRYKVQALSVDGTLIPPSTTPLNFQKKVSNSHNSNVVELRLPAQEKKLTCFDLVVEVEQVMNIENPAEQFFELKRIQSQLKGWSIKDLMELHNRHETGKRGFNVTVGSEFLSKAPEKFNWLVDTLIVQGVNMLCYADSGVGKSLLFYDLCFSIINGTPWNGFSVKQGKVLIIQTDEPSVVTARRLKKMGFDKTPPNSWYIEQNWQFSQVRQLERWIKENRPAFVMIDCLTTSNRSSASEEKDIAYTLVQNDLMKLADQYQCTIVTLHHENKMGGIRGSSGLPAHVCEVWHIRKKNNNEQLSDLHRVLEIIKSRTDCNGSHILELDPTAYKWKYQGDLEEPQTQGGNTVKALALAWLKSKPDDYWYESELIAGGIGKPIDSTRRSLRQMADQGIIDSTELPLKTSKGERMVMKYRYSRTTTFQCESDRERVKTSQGADGNPITHSRSLSRSGMSDRENVTVSQSGTFSRSHQSDRESDRERRSGKNPYTEPNSVPDHSNLEYSQIFESRPESSTTTTTTSPPAAEEKVWDCVRGEWVSCVSQPQTTEPTEVIAPDQPQQPTVTAWTEAPQSPAIALKIGSIVLSPDGRFGIVSLIYPDGEVCVDYDSGAKSIMFNPSKLIVIDCEKPLPEDAINQIAAELESCASAEELYNMRCTWPQHALEAAHKRLSCDAIVRIRGFVDELAANPTIAIASFEPQAVPSHEPAQPLVPDDAEPDTTGGGDPDDEPPPSGGGGVPATPNKPLGGNDGSDGGGTSAGSVQSHAATGATASPAMPEPTAPATDFAQLKLELPKAQVSLPANAEWLNPESPTYQSQCQGISGVSIVALDIETYQADQPKKNATPKALHPWDSRIRLVQLCVGDRTFLIDFGDRDSDFEVMLKRHQPTIELLRQVIQNPEQRIVGHNIHFDLRFLATQLGIRNAKNVVCTMVGTQVYYGDYGKPEGGNDKDKYSPILSGGYSLANLANRFLNITVDKTEQKSDFGADLTTEQLAYAARDPKITLSVYQKLEELYADTSNPLYSKGLRNCWKLECDVIPCAIEIELAGMPLDAEAAKQQLETIKGHKQRSLKNWSELCPDLNYTQRDKLLSHLNTQYNLNLKSLSKGDLDKNSRENPLMQLRLKLQGLDSLVNNLEGFLNSAARDGRVHTIYKTLTGFGRFSSGGGTPDLPNLQSIKAKTNPVLDSFNLPPVRAVISSQPGRTMAVIDLAGAHGRIAADQSEDETAISGNNDPTIDNHSKVAVFIAKSQGLDWSWEYIAKVRDDKAHPDRPKAKLFRDTAKNTYYGWLNGAGAKRIQDQIAANTGIRPSLDECVAAIEGCLALYPGVLRHRKQLMERLRTTAVPIDGRPVAVNNTSDGFRICLPLVPSHFNENRLEPPYTQSLACIWSRIEATAVKRALIQIMELREQHPEWHLEVINYVHDEIDVEVDSGFADIAVPMVNDIIGDCFAAQLKHVNDGREIDWKKLVVNSWADK